MSSKTMTLNYSEIDVKCLKLTDLLESEKSKGQKIAFFEYTHPTEHTKTPLFIQVPWIHMSLYGVPQISDYCKDDSQRMFIKVPLDQSIEEVRKFTEFLQTIDEWLGSEAFKQKVFESKASKYKYQPIVRYPIDDEDTKFKSKTVKHPYIKTKIAYCYQTMKIKTTVFISNTVNNKRIREKVECNDISQFAEHICYLSKIHPIIQPFKLWAQPTNRGTQPLYGASLKVIKLEVEKPSRESGYKSYLESEEGFISDNEDIGIKEVPAESSVKPNIVTKIGDSDSEDAESE